MPKFALKDATFEASQWFQNGDHPLDYSQSHEGMEHGVQRTFTGEERRAHDWEGDVVRYFRHPDIAGVLTCRKCGHTMHVHGWIDQKNDRIVCPGDWIVTAHDGQYVPVKPDDFVRLYAPVEPEVDATQSA